MEFDHHYGQAAAWAVMLFLTTGAARQIYGLWRTESLSSALMATLVTWFWEAMLLVLVAFFTKTSGDYSRLAIVLWFALALLFLGLVQIGLRMALKSLRAWGEYTYAGHCRLWH